MEIINNINKRTLGVKAASITNKKNHSFNRFNN